MKHIRIHAIKLTNWRGEKNRTTEFNADGQTLIMGGNGTGKSRHFDAFCWLLFGKDSQERKDFELRSYDSKHTPLHRCECSVEAVISVNEERHVLKREYKEQWTKPRGQAEEVFKGNVTECTFDGVPVTVTAFQKRVREEIIDETLFKMVTNPAYFVEHMKWQQQRETLLLMGGVRTLEEVAADNADFRKLLAEVGGKPMADFRKQIAAEKKRLKAELDEVQPRIDQTNRMKPEVEDWYVLEQDIMATRGKLEEIQRMIDNDTERAAATAAKAGELQKLIIELRAEQTTLHLNYQKRLAEEAEQKNAARREIEARCRRAADELKECRDKAARLATRLREMQLFKDVREKRLNNLREEWHAISSRAYNGADTCPHCGQKLPQYTVDKAVEIFEQKKRADLEENTRQGRELKEYLVQADGDIAEIEADTAANEARIAGIEADMTALYDELAANPEQKAAETKAEDVPGYGDKQREINEAERAIASLATESDTATKSSLIEERKEAQRRLAELTERLGKRNLIDAANAEVSRLMEHGRELAQQIADIERREYTAELLSKKRVEDCENRINSMFSMVSFKLFDTTIDGNEYEVCTPLVNGVPYQVANTASKVNAGLDIINALSRFNNVSAPIFCDNAESVTDWLHTESQMVFLKVTEDKEIFVKTSYHDRENNISRHHAAGWRNQRSGQFF